LTIARSGISRLAVWDVDRLKYIRFQRIGGACVRIAHESLPWSVATFRRFLLQSTKGLKRSLCVRHRDKNVIVVVSGHDVRADPM